MDMMMLPAVPILLRETYYLLISRPLMPFRNQRSHTIETSVVAADILHFPAFLLELQLQQPS